MLVKNRIFLITALLYILYTIFPLFADTFNIPVWLPSMAAIVVMVGLYPKAFANKTFYWFLVYALVLVLNLLLGRPLTIGIGTVADSKKILIEFAFILPTIGIFSILSYLDDLELTRKLVNWSIGMLFVSFIVAVPLIMQYESIRAALKEDAGFVSVPGLPGYSLMHAYTLFLPVLCYGSKALQGPKKWWALVGLLALCFVVYDTYVTTSLVLMIAMLVFTIFYSDQGNILFFVIFSIIVIVAYILYKAGAFISLIDWMMPAFEGTPVEFKLNDFKESMMVGHITGGSITGRMDYHEISRDSFFRNPIFGTSVVGGHSSLMDRFGGMGLVAGLPFLLVFFSFMRKMLKRYKTRKAKTFFWVGTIVAFIYLYNKGNWGCESWLMYMVLMPMGILVFEQKTIEQNNSRGLQKQMKSNNNETA